MSLRLHRRISLSGGNMNRDFTVVTKLAGDEFLVDQAKLMDYLFGGAE